MDQKMTEISTILTTLYFSCHLYISDFVDIIITQKSPVVSEEKK